MIVLSQFAEWLDVRTGLLSMALAGVVAYAGKQWGDRVVQYLASPFGICRETRKNTRAIVELRADNVVIRDQNRMLLDQFNIAYVYTDVRGKIVDVSDAWTEVFNCSRDKALSDGWVTHISPGDQDRVTRKFYETVSSKSPMPYSIEFQLDYEVAKSRAILKSTVEPLRDNTGRVIGYRGISTVLHPDPLEDKTA